MDPFGSGSAALGFGHKQATKVYLRAEYRNQARYQALVLLLLCNGYDANLERECALDLALDRRRVDIADLLLTWGADPHFFGRSKLFETYDSSLFERFYSLGVDLTTGHVYAEALGYHTSNKPLFG